MIVALSEEMCLFVVSRSYYMKVSFWDAEVVFETQRFEHVGPEMRKDRNPYREIRGQKSRTKTATLCPSRDLGSAHSKIAVYTVAQLIGCTIQPAQPHAGTNAEMPKVMFDSLSTLRKRKCTVQVSIGRYADDWAVVSTSVP